MIKNKFMLSDTKVEVVQFNDATALDELPPQVYTLNFHQMFGFWLNITKPLLALPPKIYGNAHERVQKCIQTYNDRDAATGILMTGDKGTGKSLLMSLLANTAITELGLPVILVTQAYEGERFTSFIASLGECCLVFDELGKMYKSTVREEGVHQEALLGLLDGVDKTKRLVIMTENQSMDISEFMLNRPSRIYYHFKYKKLDEVSIQDYCEDFNVGDEVIKEILDLSRRSRIFSFDMLQTIVEEHLRFGQSVSDLTDELNIDTRQEDATEMEIIRMVSKDQSVEYELVGMSPIVKKPVYGYTYISYQVKGSKPRAPTAQATNMDAEVAKTLQAVPEIGNAEDEARGMHINSENLQYESERNLVYEENDITIICRELPSRYYSYSAYF